VTDTTEGTEVEETYEANEQGVAYSSESAASADAPERPATIAPAAATGRRKEAVARVRIVPGTGKWTVNGRDLDSYFPNKLHQQVVNEPFANLQLEGRIELCSPDGEALVQAKTGDLSGFVERMSKAVEPGAESGHVDVDGTIAAIFAAEAA
jgi:small subunit ribosomal protein S9